MEASEKDGEGSPIVGLLVTVVIIAGIVGGVWWLIKSDADKKTAEAARAAASARAIAVADSLDAVARADSIVAKALADSLAFAALPKAQQRKILAERAKAAAAATEAEKKAAAPATASATAPAKPAAGGATAGTAAAGGATAGSTPAAGGATAGGAPAPAAEPAPPKEKGPFAIDAGTFLDQAQANQVAETLKAKAKLSGQVVAMEGGEFHVLLGSFSTHSAADAMAGKLFGSGALQQAVVVPIPKAP